MSHLKKRLAERAPLRVIRRKQHKSNKNCNTSVIVDAEDKPVCLCGASKRTLQEICDAINFERSASST